MHFIAAGCCLSRSLHTKAGVGWLGSFRETWLLYGKVDSDRDAFLLHLCCLCRGSCCQNIWHFAIKLAMNAADCNQPEGLGFSLWMCQPRLGFKELLNAEDSTGVTRWEQEVIVGWMRAAD